MAAPIAWESSLDAALARAEQTGRMVMLQFWGPACAMCAKMNVVTFPDDRVATTLNTHFIPVRVNFYEDPHLVEKYLAVVTSTFHFLDARGVSLYHYMGYAPPEEFLAALDIARGWKAMHEKQFAEAETHFASACSQFPKTVLAAEALYFQGLAAYRRAGTLDPVQEIWGKLLTQYPQSDWGRKISALIST